MEKEIIYGRNGVLEALKNDNVDRIIVQKGATGSITKILGKAKDNGIVIEYADKTRIDKIAGSNNHQGIVCYTSTYKYVEVFDILNIAKEKNEEPFVVILDGIEDPHNLGAIIRSCECAGVHGVIIPKRRAASINETVHKTSAGAASYIPCARVTNISKTIEELKESGLWIYALDMDGVSYKKADLKGPLCIVVGGEGNGVSRIVREKSDFIISLPIKGKINSLNASNAAAILIYEAISKR